jgi:TupA-like ATPgrasp
MIYKFKKKIRSISNSNKSIKKIYLMLNQIKVTALAKLSDEKFAKIKYKENTGKSLNLDNPITFNEKLWWLKINNRDPLLTICSDKVKVRDYVKECGLEHLLIKNYGVYNKAEDIEFDKLPDKVFLKCNHVSGINMIYDRNNEFNMKAFIDKFNSALTKNYYLQSREWNYKDIKPKIVAEEIIVDSKNNSLIDYRFLCFDGVVKMVFVDIETAAHDGSHNPYAKRNVYDRNFNYLDIKVSREKFSDELIDKPDNFEKMVEYAEILSNPFPFCRVDLYNIDGDIFFGEITFYPGGATQLVEPEEWERKMGSWINLTSKNIKRRK